ncbi:hypothetical protein FHR92_000780 [Fontibacillus solani]|uniref:Lipoprotein n=1 Tax=Fontibacillus solani TaxID=1572857 RepID=A0A7W3SQG3_9BACL|nr:hypothetical protein [Fontibacillus solani]MBA9084326.1 hypothetical protein [Fontibacillus solani]
MMMKRFWSGMIVALVLVVVAGCGGSAAPPTAAFGDTVITVGSSTPGELLDAGFTPKEYSIKLDEKTMSSKTFDSKGIEMKKGGKGYARISMMNDSNSNKAYKDCKIYSVYYNPQFQTLVYEDVLINGINFRGYTRDQVKDAMKDKKIHIEFKTMV